MVPEGHGDCENRGGTTLESVTEHGNTQTRRGGGRLSFLSDGMRRMRGLRDAGSAWARALCLRWLVGLRCYFVQSQVQARLAWLLVSHPKVF